MFVLTLAGKFMACVVVVGKFVCVTEFDVFVFYFVCCVCVLLSLLCLCVTESALFVCY